MNSATGSIVPSFLPVKLYCGSGAIRAAKHLTTHTTWFAFKMFLLTLLLAAKKSKKAQIKCCKSAKENEAQMSIINKALDLYIWNWSK